MGFQPGVPANFPSVHAIEHGVCGCGRFAGGVAGGVEGHEGRPSITRGKGIHRYQTTIG